MLLRLVAETAIIRNVVLIGVTVIVTYPTGIAVCEILLVVGGMPVKPVGIIRFGGLV